MRKLQQEQRRLILEWNGLIEFIWLNQKLNIEPLHGPKLKIDLDYNEEVHRSMKNFRPKTRLFEAAVGMVEKVGKKKRKEKASGYSSAKL